MSGPRKWDFPLDHEAHEEFPFEWWYTAGIFSQSGAEFGYHFAQFRVEDKFHSHFSIYHLATGKFEFCESVHPKSCFEVVDGDDFIFSPAFGRDEMTIFLKADSQIILQGDQGLSIKSARPEHFSHYYSIPSMQTSMRIKDVGEFTGRSWFDHEFGTNLKPKGCGWIFFFAWMDNGDTINGYLMKDQGNIDLKYSKLISIKPDGTIDKLKIEAVEQKPIVIRASGRVFKVNPMPHQTIRSRLSDYIEVPCEVKEGKLVGRGYVEMTV